MIEVVIAIVCGTFLSIMFELFNKEVTARFMLRHIRRNWDKVEAKFQVKTPFIDIDGYTSFSDNVCLFAVPHPFWEFHYYYWVMNDEGEVTGDKSILLVRDSRKMNWKGDEINIVDPNEHDFWENLVKPTPGIWKHLFFIDKVPIRSWHKKKLQSLSDETFLLQKMAA